MNFLIVGPGKMGQAIRAIAETRGHRCLGEWDATRREPKPHAEIAFEFSRPEAAAENVCALLDSGISVICGTTGWDATGLDRRAPVDGVAWIVAPNFSIGMHLFARIVREAAATAGRKDLYRPWIVERHHRGKRDNPSGTARMLSQLVQSYGRGADDMPVVGVRTGFEPGTHTVGFDGQFDEIRLTHSARSRDGFAQGAVLAAEWLSGRTGGCRFDEVVESLGERGESDGTR